jgi:cobalt transporter subunit CbtB
MSVSYPAGFSATRTRLSQRGAAAVAAMLGLFLIWGVGFAAPHVLHEAAHDTRHAIGFPCH